MYRGITLSSSVSKLFELVLLNLFRDYLQSDMLQYGFKRNTGCVDALFTFNESIRYFTSRGSRVFCVSLDANKAFDRVLTPVFHSNCYRNVYLLNLLNFFVSGIVDRPAPYCGTLC